jgi:hypothetical protein
MENKQMLLDHKSSIEKNNLLLLKLKRFHKEFTSAPGMKKDLFSTASRGLSFAS